MFHKSSHLLVLTTASAAILCVAGAFGVSTICGEDSSPAVPAQKVLARAWVVDLTQAEPGREVLVQAVSGIRFRLGQDEDGETSTVRQTLASHADGPDGPGASLQFALTTHGRRLPVQADVELNVLDPKEVPYTLEGQLTLEEQRIYGLLGPGGKMLLLVQVSAVE